MKLIGIAAYSGVPPPRLADEACKFIECLASKCKDIALVLGGYWGLMKVVVDRAIELSIPTILLPPIDREDIEYPHKAIVLRLGVDYRVRSVFIARAADVLVALGGESGTMQEIVTAYCESKPVIVLRSGLSTDKLELLSPYLDTRRLSRIRFVSTGEELCQEVIAELKCFAQDDTSR